MLLDKGADPNLVYPNSDYGTALQAAGYQGTVENVKILLDRGAIVNPDVSGEYGTPLTAACAQGNTEIVRLLLDHRADPNCEGGEYGFAIVAASEGGNEDILRLLLSHEANVDVNVKSPSGETPLTNAALELPLSCLELLVQHGAWLHVRDEDQDTALTNAASTGDSDSVRYLLEQGLDVQHIGNRGGALYLAIDGGKSLECVEILLEYHVDVNQQGGLLHTPLQAAVHNMDLDCIQFLLDNHADVNLTGGKYHTALLAAVVADDIERVRLLLQHGADTLEAGGYYGSVLHAAIYVDEPIGMIDLLLEHGADIDAVHDRGTPLQLAAAYTTTDVTTHLLQKGADPNLVIGKHGTALQAACILQDDDVVDELLEYSADPLLRGGYYGSGFAAAAANGMKGYVQKWLEDDPPGDILVEALHFAVHFRQTDIVKVLLDHDVDVNVKSRLFGSAMLAVDAKITDTERAILEGDEDFWKADEEDQDDDDDDDEEEEEGEEDGQSEGDIDDDGSEDDEAEKEIRALLAPLTQGDTVEENGGLPPNVEDNNAPASDGSSDEGSTWENLKQGKTSRFGFRKALKKSIADKMDRMPVSF